MQPALTQLGTIAPLLPHQRAVASLDALLLDMGDVLVGALWCAGAAGAAAGTGEGRVGRALRFLSAPRYMAHEDSKAACSPHSFSHKDPAISPSSPFKGPQFAQSAIWGDPDAVAQALQDPLLKAGSHLQPQTMGGQLSLRSAQGAATAAGLAARHQHSATGAAAHLSWAAAYQALLLQRQLLERLAVQHQVLKDAAAGGTTGQQEGTSAEASRGHASASCASSSSQPELQHALLPTPCPPDGCALAGVRRQLLQQLALDVQESRGA